MQAFREAEACAGTSIAWLDKAGPSEYLAEAEITGEFS
jgi:hypothetical protein